MVVHPLGQIGKHIKSTMNQFFGVKLRIRTLPQSSIQHTNNAQCIIELGFPLLVYAVHSLCAFLFAIVVRAILGNGLKQRYIVNESFANFIINGCFGPFP